MCKVQNQNFKENVGDYFHYLDVKIEKETRPDILKGRTDLYICLHKNVKTNSPHNKKSQ